MKVTLFLGVIFTALLYLVPIYMTEKKVQIQAQEESPMEALSYGPNTFKISYTVTDPSENELADIIWMKKAAQFAINEGVPFFNIVDQNTFKTYSDLFQEDRITIEGVIELDRDSMGAEYDAQEIDSLVLPDLIQ